MIKEPCESNDIDCPNCECKNSGDRTKLYQAHITMFNYIIKLSIIISITTFNYVVDQSKARYSDDIFT